MTPGDRDTANVWFQRGWFWLVLGLGLCLYLPFLSRSYDLNGLTEAIALEAGRPADLFDPNHMLYRPFGYMVRRILAIFGMVASSVSILQVLSAVFGAIGIGFVYLSAHRITANRTAAIWASVLLGVSWSYWTLSTDVYYFSMAAMFSAAALYFFVRSESGWSFVACGLLTGASILACQANLFLLPGFSLALLLREPRAGLQRIAQRAALICGSAGAVVAIAFAGIGFLVYGQNSAAGFFRWSSSYAGNALPMWGSWAPERFLAAAGSAFKSILGMDLWMFWGFHRIFRNGILPGWVAPLGFVILAGGLILTFRWGVTKRKGDDRTILWLLLMYSAYMPFIIWWEAIEPRWFIFPNIFLAVLAAVIASRWAEWRYLKFALATTLLVLGGLNLATSAWPKRFKLSIPAQMAACVAGHMNPQDLFLATEWNWAGYLPYVHNRDMVSFIAEVSRTGDKKLAVEGINKEILERQRQGSRVYITDIRSYPPTHMQWLQEQTKLTANDLSVYTGHRTFECVYSNFYELDPLPESGEPSPQPD